MKKSLFFYAMLLAALFVSGLSSCTQEGDDYANRHAKGGGNDDDDEILEKACEALQQVSDVYMECRSIADLKERAEEISKIENVEDVHFSDISMFVKVKGFMTVSFCFYPEQKVPQTKDFDYLNTRIAGTRASLDKTTSNLGFEKAVIIDQQLEDMNWEVYKQGLKELLERVGIKTEINNTPTLDYFVNDLFDNDIVLFISHGHYDRDTQLHWLDLTNLEEFNWDLYHVSSMKEHLLNGLTLALLQDVTVEDEMLQMTITQHWETYRYVMRAHFSISEKFISSIKTNFKKPGKALVFNVACQSLKAGDNSVKDMNQHDFAFAQAFIDRGAGVYFGYDESNGEGQQGALQLLSSIASGQSVLGAYNSLPEWILHDYWSEKKPPYTADLFYYPEDHFEIENCCQVFPTLQEKEETDETIILSLTEPYNLMQYKGEKKNGIFTVTEMKFNNYEYTYGFEVSTTKDFVPSKTKEYGLQLVNDNSSYYGFSDDDYILFFTYPVPKNDLAPSTTYYYRAYLDDGTNKYYSDYKDFTTAEKKIERVVPIEILEPMEPYIPIYEGENPPDIQGTYVIDPMEIVYDKMGNYEPGYNNFSTLYFNISNQNFTTNTLDYREKEIGNGGVASESEGNGAFVSGEGNNFTVFFNTTGVTHLENYDVDTTDALIISGTKTSDGIRDLHYAFVIVKKSADPDNRLMKEGDFRVFKDGDNWAETTSWPSGTRVQQITVRDGIIFTPWSIRSIRSR